MIGLVSAEIFTNNVETILHYSTTQPPDNGKSKSFVITRESKWNRFIKIMRRRGISQHLMNL